MFDYLTKTYGITLKEFTIDSINILVWNEELNLRQDLSMGVSWILINLSCIFNLKKEI